MIFFTAGKICRRAISIKLFLIPSLILLFFLLINLAGAQASAPYPQSPTISGVTFDSNNYEQHGNGADQWVMSWADDGNIYGVWGDGYGWSGNTGTKYYMGITQIQGNPPGLTGSDIWLGNDKNRKPNGFIADANKKMYLFYGTPNDNWDGSFGMSSNDNGKTWTDTGKKVFSYTADGVLVVGIAQFGPGYTKIPAGVDGNYFYVYLSDRWTGKDGKGKAIYLGRVPKTEVFNRSSYTYFNGLGADKNPIWSSQWTIKQPAFYDPSGMEYHVNVSYNPTLNKFIFAKGQNTSHLGLFEGANLWGPWNTIYYSEFQDSYWKFTYQFPQKWMGADGKTMWMAWSGWPEYDKVSFIKANLTLSPSPTPTPTGTPNPVGVTQERVFYLSPSGNDSLAGNSELAAWATFSRAWKTLQPGDTLLLLDGIYRQTLNPQKEGQPGKPITIKAKNDGKAIIDGEGVRKTVFLDHWAGNEYIVIEGIVARNSSASVYDLYGASNNILRRVSGYDANVDTNSFVFMMGTGSNNNLLEDCVASGTGRKMIGVYTSTGNTIRRCFADWQRWDGREWHDAWPWGENIDIYNSSNNIVENSIGYGSVPRYNITVRSNQSTSNANSNKILGSIAVFASMDKSKYPMEPLIWDSTRPQPSTSDPSNVVDIDSLGYKVGFKMFGSGAMKDNLFKDVLAYYNGSYGFHMDATPTNTTIERATFFNNTRRSTSGGELGIDALLRDLNLVKVVNSYIGKVWDKASNTYSAVSGEGARLDHRYVNGVLMDGTNGQPAQPLWPWPMEDRIKNEMGISITWKILDIIQKTPTGSALPSPTPVPVPSNTPTPTPTPTVSTPSINPSTITITNTIVANGKTYPWQTSLATKEKTYTDRNYFYTSVPAEVLGLDYLQTSNSDKDLNPASDDILSFEVNQDVTVYIAHDDRIKDKPSWLSSFTDTNSNLVTDDITLSLFKKDFQAGTITIGSNVNSPSNLSMYTAMVKPLGSMTTTLPTPTTTQPEPTPTPTSCTISSGSWSATPVVEGNNVGLNVTATGDCSGKQINYQVRRNIPLQPDQPAQNLPSPNPLTLTANGSSFTATTSWTTDPWQNACGIGTCDPQYFFKANIVGDTSELESNPRLLTVTKIGAGGSGPQINNISDNASSYPNSQIPKYEKFEITFDLLNTTASNFQLPFDPNPPAGIDPDNPLHKGISVDALFTPDNWQTTYKQPAFYYQYFDDQIKKSSGGQDHEWNYPTGKFAWKVRFAPNKEGNWQYKIVAQDKGGQVESEVQSFIVNSSNNQGFIKVSSKDPRYFEFDNGVPFYGLGFQDNLNSDDPVLKNESNYQKYAQNNINFLRVWTSGLYGASWLEWLGGRNIYDGYLPRAGLEPFHDPVSNKDTLTQRIDYETEGDTGWYDACRFQFWNDPEAIKQNTNYKLKIKYWGVDIKGPRVPTQSNYGLVGKISADWHPNCYEPGTGTVITNYGGNTSDWESIEGTWNSGNNNFIPKIYLGLENVIQGKVYIQSISLREDLGNGQYGPEILKEPSMQYELYLPETSAYSLDKVVELARKYGIYLKLSIEEKQDPIFYKLDDDGTFVIGEPDNTDGFYGLGRTINKTRWLQQSYWRYLQARYGYSTNIHSWELTNEGDPGLTKHYEMTDEFGKFMGCGVFGINTPEGDSQKCNSNHPNSHLVTTSFWHSFPAAQFWMNTNYPNVDYADVHAYISTSNVGVPKTELEKMQWDSAYFHSGHSTPLGGWEIGKPIIRGETGIDSLAQQKEQPNLTKDTQGVWLHKFNWAQLDQGGMYELYWWTDNIKNLPGPDGDTANGLYEVYKPFKEFLSGIPLNNGNYQNIGASASNAALRVFGQKDTINGKAHLWIDNKNHTWKSEVDNITVAPASGTVTFSGMPAGIYAVSWYDTYSGKVLKTESILVASDNNASLDVSNLTKDIAVKIEGQGIIAPTPTPTPTSSIDPLSITNTTVVNGKIYTWQKLISTGAKVYTDRTFTYTTVPIEVLGLNYLQTANSDKDLNPSSGNILSFDTNEDVTIYIAHDDRIKDKPSWLSSFTDTNSNLITNDTTLSLFKKDFKAGTITLGSNVTTPSNDSMYTVIVKPLGNL